MTPAPEHARDDPTAVPLTRRTLLQRAGAMATLSALPGVLAACGDSPPPGEETVPTAASVPPTEAGAGTATQPTTPDSPGAAPPSVSGSLASPVLTEDEAASPAAAPAGSPSAEARLAQFMALSAVLVGGGRLQPERGVQFLSLVDADPGRQSALAQLLAEPPAAALATPAATPIPLGGSAIATPIAATPEIGGARGGSAIVATPEDAATPVAGATPAAEVAAEGGLPPGAGAAGATPEAGATPVAAVDIRQEILSFWYRGVFDGQPVPERDTFWFTLSAWQATAYTTAPSACKAYGSWAQPPEAA